MIALRVWCEFELEKLLFFNVFFGFLPATFVLVSELSLVRENVKWFPSHQRSWTGGGETVDGLQSLTDIPLLFVSCQSRLRTSDCAV